MPNPPVIAIVEDDAAVREALFDLLQVEGFPARTFESATAFLSGEDVSHLGCIISDVRMPGIDGIELQRRLRARGSATPMIFITSSTDDALRVQALRDGADAWFTKPVADEALLSALRAALQGHGGDGGRDASPMA